MIADGGQEVRKAGNLEGKKIGSLEGKPFTLNSLSSNPPTLLSSSNHSGGNASLIPPYGLKKRIAFTLAEVLITLGIIGIVAALTLPTLISNHKKQVYVTQLKKTVNTLQNGYRLILADNGVDNLQYTDFDKRLKNLDSNYMRKYFNIISDLRVLDDERVYKKISFDANSHSGGSSTNQTFTLKDCILATTADGADLCFDKSWIYVFVDVNGYNKLPNTQGYDYFAIDFLHGDGSFYVSGLGQYCGRADDDSYISTACFERVVEDGWKINY